MKSVYKFIVLQKVCCAFKCTHILVEQKACILLLTSFLLKLLKNFNKRLRVHFVLHDHENCSRHTDYMCMSTKTASIL